MSTHHVTTTAPPVLSTPSELAPAAAAPSNGSSLSEDELYIRYEIPRTIAEIREGRWKRIALQFPDEMLVDAPRVSERLRDGLRRKRSERPLGRTNEDPVEDLADKISNTDLSSNGGGSGMSDEVNERLTILADTSYGACCIDEVAAEHVDAEVVVHYGRACLSPTARLPVIYVFTSKPMDLDTAVTSFQDTYPERSKKVCLMADIPYTQHILNLCRQLQDKGYSNVFATEVIRNPSSLLPNRTLPPNVEETPKVLKEYSIFHISDPPTALLLILSSRVKDIYVFPTSTPAPLGPLPASSTTALMRRRYALVTRLPAVPILGILINTLSVSNYMVALQHCQDLISRAGKKSYVFVVGKVNTAKLANFAEIGAWVVIGCWESSLIDSTEFFAPLVTPFELEVGLQGDTERQWGQEWESSFDQVIRKEKANGEEQINEHGTGKETASRDWNEEASDDEPPDFDLRTGRYVARSRPMGRSIPTATQPMMTNGDHLGLPPVAPPSSALVQRAKGDVATINGAISPAAEFLRGKRTWQGLGTDCEVAYERDEDGRIRGAAIEEGRKGVARGYKISGSEEG